MANKQQHARPSYDSQSGKAWSFGRHRWDVLAALLVLCLISALGFTGASMLKPYHTGQAITIHLSPDYLPYYALHTIARMLIALFFSFLMTFIFATWAAKNRLAERIIIPAIDILQSVPVLSFLTITVPAFLYLFPNSMLGPECAAIFAIFTAQVWNMALSFYQSLTSIPQDLYEVADAFHLSAWQKFWRIDVPYAMPGLLWNAMMSMSGSWVYLIYSEAITIAGKNIALPGVGSYIARAISQANLSAVFYAIGTMFIVILAYDQLLFRPLVVWCEKFKNEITASEAEPQSWVHQIFVRSQLCQKLRGGLGRYTDMFINNRLLRRNLSKTITKKTSQKKHLFSSSLSYAIIALTLLIIAWRLTSYLASYSSWHGFIHLCYLGLLTGGRVIALIIICSLIWFPIGVWIGLKPRLAHYTQAVAQFLAAFPVNLLFPFIVTAILRFHLNVNYWSAPLMVLGTQWYILFNVIAGASVIPQNQHQAAAIFKVNGWLWWRKLIIPSVFPYYITGAITAAGGAWNMSIIAEALSWGSHHLYAQGLGGAIAKAAAAGNIPELTLATIIMSIYVIIINRLLWKPLYEIATTRYGSAS